MDFKKPGPETALYCLIGYPVKHTLSPVMHNAAFQKLGLNALYLAFEVRPEDLEKAVHGLVALGFMGFNVTVPHKQSIMKFLESVDPIAQKIGAVNTVKIEWGKLYGFNTDATGFLKSLQEQNFSPAGKKAVILGAGGAARAVAVALLQEGLDFLVIANRTLERAEGLKHTLKRMFYVEIETTGLASSRLKRFLETCDLLINATTLGLHPEDPPPIPLEWIHPNLFVYDLIYNPPETPLLKHARETGAKTCNGISMLVHQGAEAFEIWTGKKPPLSVMFGAVEQALSHGNSGNS